MEQDRQPGTETADPAEGKRDDSPTEPVAHPQQPGTMTQPPAEGGDDADGAGRSADGAARPPR